MKRTFKKSRTSFQRKMRRSLDKMNKKKKKGGAGDDGPTFDLEEAMKVGENPDLPHISIEIYDMDYGKRGDFMGEARLSPSRFFEIASGEGKDFMLPLMVRLGTKASLQTIRTPRRGQPHGIFELHALR